MKKGGEREADAECGDCMKAYYALMERVEVDGLMEFEISERVRHTAWFTIRKRKGWGKLTKYFSAELCRVWQTSRATMLCSELLIGRVWRGGLFTLPHLLVFIQPCLLRVSTSPVLVSYEFGVAAALAASSSCKSDS